MLVLWIYCVCICVYTYLQGGAKIGLQLFIWKIIQKLINNNTRINSVSCTQNCKPTFAPPCVTAIELKIFTFSSKFKVIIIRRQLKAKINLFLANLTKSRESHKFQFNHQLCGPFHGHINGWCALFFPLFSKAGSGTSSAGATWHCLIRNANSRTPLQKYWIKKPGGEAY